VHNKCTSFPCLHEGGMNMRMREGTSIAYSLMCRPNRRLRSTLKHLGEPRVKYVRVGRAKPTLRSRPNTVRTEVL